MLGTGLGSVVRVLHGKGYDTAYTLVENDKLILQWAMEFLEEMSNNHLEPVCSDAKVFMAQNKATYDLIFIDIFIGRVVPDFVTDIAFLKQCKNSLNPGGRIAFNYIINDMKKWTDTKQVFTELFPKHTVINYEINRIFVTE